MSAILSELWQNFDLTYTALIVVIFLGAAIVKGFLGIGLPAASMAFLTLLMPPTEAIPLLWLSILATNSLQFAHAPNKREIMREYWLFALAIMVCIFVTAMFIADYPTALLTVAIGVAMVLFSLNLLLGIKLNIGPGRGWQAVFGVISGTLGGISSIWSPTVAMYLVARDVDKERFIGATGFLFLAGVLPLGAGQVVAGVLTLPMLVKSAFALVVVLIGFRIGEGLRAHVSQAFFRKAVLIAFLLMGLRLIANGLAA
ncbi:sulfite exporter TauE/SafE family protein [Roseobacteraceae bacterium S113]